MTGPLNPTEWLEATRIGGGPMADFATEILNFWTPDEEIEESPEVKEAWEAAEKAEDKLAAVERAITDHSFASEFVSTGHNDTDDELNKLFDFAQQQSDQLDAIRVVLIDGGVLDPRDLTTNLADILAMFVPPVE